MPGRIPQSFIDDLLARIDIVEIVNSRVPLRKTGTNFSACCPFHSEKTPSFTVSQTKQFYYCFGCGANGNAIGFLMNFDHMEFLDAIETLAAQAGVEVPHDILTKEDSGAIELYSILEQSSNYYKRELKNSNTAINYLKSRGLSGEVCKQFAIGYAPAGWNNLMDALGKDKKPNNLVAAGITLEKNGKYYDRFRDRIMFPIRDQRGRVIGFGGRTLGEETPKYLNTPETAAFHKGSELYGLYEAKQYDNKLETIIVVEGYMDVVALAQYGINYAVATLGTATTPKHIQKLLRYTKHIVFCFDGDKAGEKAAWRALENALPLMRDDTNMTFLFLPQGTDPDSQIRNEGLEKFNTRVAASTPLSELFFTHISAKSNLKTVDGRANVAKAAINLLDKIPNGVFKQLMLDKLATLVHCQPEHFDALLSQKKAPAQPKTSSNLHPLVSNAIKLLLNSPQLTQQIPDISQITSCTLPGINILIKLLSQTQEQPGLTTGALLEYWRDTPEQKKLARLAAEEIIILDLKNEFIDTIQRLQDQKHEKMIQELLKKASDNSISEKERSKLQKLIIDAKIKVLEEKEK